MGEWWIGGWMAITISSAENIAANARVKLACPVQYQWWAIPMMPPQQKLHHICMVIQLFIIPLIKEPLSTEYKSVKAAP